MTKILHFSTDVFTSFLFDDALSQQRLWAFRNCIKDNFQVQKVILKIKFRNFCVGNHQQWTRNNFNNTSDERNFFFRIFHPRSIPRFFPIQLMSSRCDENIPLSTVSFCAIMWLRIFLYETSIFFKTNGIFVSLIDKERDANGLWDIF